MNEYNQSRADRPFRVAEILIGIVIVALLIALVSGSVGSAFGSREDMEKEFAKLAEQAVVHAVDHMEYQAGDTYHITVDGDTDTDLLAASHALLETVSIYATFSVRQGRQVTTVTYCGSGVIYSLDKDRGDAYIITNYHVIYNGDAVDGHYISDDISLFLYGKESMESYAIDASFVGGSPKYDIAVLKVSGSSVLRSSAASAVSFADSDDVSILDTAVAVGNPEGAGLSATVGYINVDSENIYMQDVTDATVTVPMRVMRIDTAVNSGNSGGGLFNVDGELIGIVNAKSGDTAVENIGYAIPSNVVKNLTENILYYCDGKSAERVYRCILGITVGVASSEAISDTESGKLHIKETVHVAEVTSGTLADGKIQAGDIIKEIRVGNTAKTVERTFHVVDTMLNARVGDTVTFVILRGQTQIEVDILISASALTEY